MIFRKVFFIYFDRKTLFTSCKNLKILCYLLIISNLALKLFIVIYFVLIFFSIPSFRIWFNLIFISTLVLIFMIIIWFSLFIFLIKIFYLSDLVLIFFIWNNLWNCKDFLISSSFNLFYLLDLISVILIIIYFIWDNL